MHIKVPCLKKSNTYYIENKSAILAQWFSYNGPKEILNKHEIDVSFFINKYASGVFDYFMDVILERVKIGNCPVMEELLRYLKVREISADELFEICTHFRRSMIDFSYDKSLNSKELFDEISYIFDENFKGILKFYTDTIFQKLIDARQEAILASQAKEYFLSNISHEIRTPLNAVLGFVNILLHEDMSKKQHNYLEIINNSGKNLLGIINDILDFSKLRSGEFTIEYKPFSLHEEIAYTMELFVAQASIKNITILAFIDPYIPFELIGDGLRIKQIISNFLSNAIKFTPQNGEIIIEAFYKEKQLYIHVRDNGIGIGVDDLNNVFTAFTQVQNRAHPSKSGTGLGLSICKQLVEKMNGKISVDSLLEKGSTFSVSIPVIANGEISEIFDNVEEFRKLSIVLYAKDEILDNKHKSFLRYAESFSMNVKVVSSFDTLYDIGVFIYEELDEVQKIAIINSQKKHIALMSKEYDDFDSLESIQSLHFPLYCSKIHMEFTELMYPSEALSMRERTHVKYKGHILVAEDNEANQALISTILYKYGLSYDMVDNGVDAVEAYKKKNYNLILMDEQMPLMNGSEALVKIIEYELQKSIAHTPIAVLTADVLKGSKERGLLSGFDIFLDKPLVLKELEKVFTMYLHTDSGAQYLGFEEIQSSEEVLGLDTKKLQEELKLSKDELLMLLKLFLKKMNEIIPQLYNAIESQNYIKISNLTHSIKGSSGNFRIQELQDLAAQMESQAQKKESGFPYSDVLKKIEKIVLKIKIL